MPGFKSRDTMSGDKGMFNSRSMAIYGIEISDITWGTRGDTITLAFCKPTAVGVEVGDEICSGA